MAVAKPKKIVKTDEINVPIPIRFFCPVCKTSKKLKIAKSVINQSGQLTTISIPKNKVCEHHFQAFIDANFIVRGYQRVDFEFSDDIIKEKEDPFTNLRENDKKIFNEINFQGNHVEYDPQETQKNDTDNQNKNKNEDTLEKEEPQQLKREEKSEESPKRKEMTLEEIYDEFWEFIDDNNHEFREFIVKDPRRGTIA